jgi:hypothetical protein
LTNSFARLTSAIRGELLVIDARHIHVKIEAIKQRTGDSLLKACVSIYPPHREYDANKMRL